jgi:hypothetical protein
MGKAGNIGSAGFGEIPLAIRPFTFIIRKGWGSEANSPHAGVAQW